MIPNVNPEDNLTPLQLRQYADRVQRFYSVISAMAPYSRSESEHFQEWELSTIKSAIKDFNAILSCLGSQAQNSFPLLESGN